MSARKEVDGARIAFYRKRLGLSVTELAARIGSVESTIRGIESGANVNPRIATVLRLLEALGLRPGDLAKVLRPVEVDDAASATKGGSR